MTDDTEDSTRHVLDAIDGALAWQPQTDPFTWEGQAMRWSPGELDTADDRRENPPDPDPEMEGAYLGGGVVVFFPAGTGPEVFVTRGDIIGILMEDGEVSIGPFAFDPGPDTDRNVIRHGPFRGQRIDRMVLDEGGGEDTGSTGLDFERQMPDPPTIASIYEDVSVVDPWPGESYGPDHVFPAPSRLTGILNQPGVTVQEDERPLPRVWTHESSITFDIPLVNRATLRIIMGLPPEREVGFTTDGSAFYSPPPPNVREAFEQMTAALAQARLTTMARFEELRALIDRLRPAMTTQEPQRRFLPRNPAGHTGPVGVPFRHRGTKAVYPSRETRRATRAPRRTHDRH